MAFCFACLVGNTSGLLGSSSGCFQSALLFQCLPLQAAGRPGKASDQACPYKTKAYKIRVGHKLGRLATKAAGGRWTKTNSSKKLLSTGVLAHVVSCLVFRASNGGNKQASKDGVHVLRQGQAMEATSGPQMTACMSCVMGKRWRKRAGLAGLVASPHTCQALPALAIPLSFLLIPLHNQFQHPCAHPDCAVTSQVVGNA
eukprot:1157469-Pelagomonas_calceolata.AAC.7